MRKWGQCYTQRQPVTMRIAACPVRVSSRLYPLDVGVWRTSPKRVTEARSVVWAEDIAWDPWWLLADWPVVDQASAGRVFRM